MEAKQETDHCLGSCEADTHWSCS